MLHHSSDQFAPNMATQQCLVGTIARPAATTEWVVHDGAPYGFPGAPVLCQSGTPEPAKHGFTVERMVSHNMQRLLTFEPLLHCANLTRCDGRVKIPREENVDLGVKGDIDIDIILISY